MLNLLPTDERHVFRREEYLRFLSVTALLGALLAGLSALILIPSLSVLMFERISVVREHTALGHEIRVQAQDSALVLFEHDARALKKTLSEPVPSSFLALVLTERKEGIVLETLTYKQHPAQLIVSGIARGREDLVAFAHALEAVPEFTSVALPVSGLAKNADIPFTLSLSVSETLTRSP